LWHLPHRTAEYKRKKENQNNAERKPITKSRTTKEKQYPKLQRKSNNKLERKNKFVQPKKWVSQPTPRLRLNSKRNRKKPQPKPKTPQLHNYRILIKTPNPPIEMWKQTIKVQVLHLLHTQSWHARHGLVVRRDSRRIGWLKPTFSTAILKGSTSSKVRDLVLVLQVRNLDKY
jgi:hypothetical protein